MMNNHPLIPNIFPERRREAVIEENESWIKTNWSEPIDSLPPFKNRNLDIMEYASEHVMAEFITAKFMDGLLKNIINTK